MVRPGWRCEWKIRRPSSLRFDATRNPNGGFLGPAVPLNLTLIGLVLFIQQQKELFMNTQKVTRAATQLSLAFLIAPLAYAQTPAPSPDGAGPYRVSQTFHIGGEGAWDYLTVDAEHKLLYVPRSTHT